MIGLAFLRKERVTQGADDWEAEEHLFLLEGTVGLSKRLHHAAFSRRLYRLIRASSYYVLAALKSRAYPGHGMRMPPILLVTLPKAGSVYIQRALRSTLQIPWGAIRQAGIVDITFEWSSLRRFSRGNVLTRVHLPPRSYLAAALPEVGIGKIVLHLRDPRTQIISWTRHVDREIRKRGIAGGMLSCQLKLPERYEAWSFEARLQWQVENQLFRFVDWMEAWLQIAETTPGLDTLVTSYESFARSPSGYVQRVCDFYDIPLHHSWLRLPDDTVGKNNIYYKETAHPAAIMGDRLYDIASAVIPAEMSARFGW